MFILVTDSNDPHFNLAAEDYLLHDRDEDFIILAINDPSVIIGKHQVAHREVNIRYTDQRQIPILRRISGGGTVYHDQGNLNFAFIRNSEQGKQVDFRLYTGPVISFLETLGVNASFEGRNDLKVDGLKISGNAEHVFRNRVLHHGTLLFSASLDDLRQSLRPSGENYSSRGIESNRTSVTNLGPRLPYFSDINDFRSAMADYFRNTVPGIEDFGFSHSEIEKISALEQSKYKTWEWNFGYGPPYTFSSSLSLGGSTVHCRFYVKDGIIWESEISGNSEAASAGKSFIGCRHMPADIKGILARANIQYSENEIYGFF